MEELQLSPVIALTIIPIGCILVLVGYATEEIFSFPAFGLDLNLLRITGWALIAVGAGNLIQLRIQKKRYTNQEQYR